MKIVFRVDASLQIGSGHLMRCLTFADALAAQSAQCHFISRELDGNLLALIRQRGYAADALPAPTEPTAVATPKDVKNDSCHRMFYQDWLGFSWHEDAEQTRAILKTLQPDWLVVDHYALDHRWEITLRPYVKHLMVMDDLADRGHQCDLLLDQNLGRQPKDYANLVPAQCNVLTGPHYALLRPEFAALRTYSLQRRQPPALKQILITMGGVDQSNATGQVLQALRGCVLPQGCNITVVMGQQAPWIEHIRTQAEKMSWPTEVLVNISDMAQRMADSDLAIGAAGSTSWERCCLGLPTLMVVLADNQLPGAKALQVAGAASLLGDVRDIDSQLMGAVQLLANEHELINMSKCASAITDGYGIEKTIQALKAVHA